MTASASTLGAFPASNYDEAVKNLERAVGSSPTIRPSTTTSAMPMRDRARTLEAQFQWAHADLKPQPEDLVEIKQKLATGLPEASSAANAGKKKPDGG